MGKKDLEVKMAPEASWLVVIFVLLAGVASTIGGVIATFSHKADTGLVNQANLEDAIQCMYQKNFAQAVAFISALCLAVGHAVASMNGGCVCCCTLTYAKGKAHFYSMVLFSMAWASFLISMIFFLSGAYINSFHTSTTFFAYDYDLRRCFTVKSYVYLVAASTAFATAFLDILYYAQAQKSKFEAWVEQGAPTPRIYNAETKKTFVIAGPAKRGPLRDLEPERVRDLKEPQKIRKPGPRKPKDGRPPRHHRRDEEV